MSIINLSIATIYKISYHTDIHHQKMDLLKHLWSEDQWVYPVLLKASKHNKKMEEILSVFTNGLGELHDEMQNFITRYSKGAKDNNFQRDYERLFDTLSKRIEYEENILFSEYEKITQ